MAGPYNTYAELAAEPLMVEIAALHADTTLSQKARREKRAEILRTHMLGAFGRSGVLLGTQEIGFVDWLLGWEPESVQKVIGWLSRANRTEATPPTT